MKIKSIMVVGGGSSGSMAAAAIAKVFGDRVKLSILEGKNTSPIGVGESAMIKFNDYREQIIRPRKLCYGDRNSGISFF